ncbi:MAG: DUF3667 domain-containing protein [Pseudoxanthomonas suwonensis]|nr:DUF3667 domain-containing protein [Pseudoxanthomonas suwonensis]
MTEMTATRCANCGRAVEGAGQAFCPACGQPTPAHRIDWHFLVHELEHSVLHMDRGVFFTLRNLLLRPGHMIRDYIEGRRAGIVKPLLLIMMTAALLIVLAKYLLAGDLVGTVLAVDAGSGQPEDLGKLDVDYLVTTFGAIKAWMNQHYTVLTLLMLPLEALAFKLAFRRVGGLNYPEWLVITTFLTAQSFVLQAIAMPLQRAWPQMQGTIMLVAAGYGAVSLVQYFGRDHARWKIAIRAVLGYGMVMLISITLNVLVALAVVLKAFRP